MAEDKDAEATIYAQVDANLDTHPKVRRAGNLGRQVFEFVLRRNALRGSKGFIPVSYVTPEYLADILMMTVDEAQRGIDAAINARLIELVVTHGDGGDGVSSRASRGDGSDNRMTPTSESVVQIVGWHPSWGRRPKEGKERTAGWRERKKSKTLEPVTHGDGGDETPSRVTDGDESDVREVEVEERKIDQISRSRARAIPPSTAYDHANRQQVDALLDWTWRAISDARVAVAIELGIVHVLPLPRRQNTPSESRGCRDLRDRIREEGAGAPAVCARIVEALTAEARATTSVEWLGEKAFTEGGWRHAREAIPGWRSPRAGPRPAGAAIGAASPRTDHPESTELKPIGDMLR